jgi:citrate lyase subunit beta/citryl-CoA lyase
MTGTTRDTPRWFRSYLFAPGSNERLLQRVFDAGADAVVLDLEDAVLPADKARARTLVAGALASRPPASRPPVFVRINAVASGLWLDDLMAVVGPSLAGIRLAKAESRAEVEAVAAVLDELERARGLDPGQLALVATIESARGVLAAEAIAGHPRVSALAFGATDFLRDVGATAGPDDRETLHARSHLVLVSRAAGLAPPIAPVHTNVSDLDGLRRTTEADRRLGFFGRSCIHPAQVPVVNDVFTPSAAEVEEARRLLDAFERAAAGAALLADGSFVDRAVARRARAILQLAEPARSAAPVQDVP